MLQSPCPTPPLCYSAAHSGALLSQMSGVLAGFAFTAIVLLIERHERRSHQGGEGKSPRLKEAATSKESTRQSHLDAGLRSLFGAFISLLISTFLYEVVGACLGDCICGLHGVVAVLRRCSESCSPNGGAGEGGF